jgi:hypothetical protein
LFCSKAPPDTPQLAIAIFKCSISICATPKSVPFQAQRLSFLLTRVRQEALLLPVARRVPLHPNTITLVGRGPHTPHHFSRPHTSNHFSFCRRLGLRATARSRSRDNSSATMGRWGAVVPFACTRRTISLITLNSPPPPPPPTANRILDGVDGNAPITFSAAPPPRYIFTFSLTSIAKTVSHQN